MRLSRLDSADPRDVLRALRGAVLGAGPAVALGAPEGVPDDVPAGTAVVVTTSGSTGYPKSVALSRSALTSSALATAERIGSGSWLLALPATYVAGVQVMVRALVAGRDPAILSGSFTPQTFTAAASAMAASEAGHRIPTYTSLVPAQVQTLVDAGESDAAVARALASFEAVLVGGQALPPALADRAAALGARIVRTYGSTETSGGCVYDGRPLEGVRLRIEDGEVQIGGPMIADGYLEDPARTAEVFVRDQDGSRWYRTGDVGSFDEGLLRVTGRRDNVIVSGGVNVSLDRVERVVRTVEGLTGAVVVPTTDERWGAASVVVLSRPALAGRSEADLLAELRLAVKNEIGAPARPRELLVLEEVPLTSSGKPDRALLRSLLADEDGLAPRGE
ncbi:acyl-CoA synthetase [Microbacterium oleivorans]|uniref:AMP-binding protein n=1 Tax=Microbacterium oleivorans TaxID=273677 RepID=UPI0010A3FF86|nr:AMP-binding protein [Microbacterium oleivorans]THE08165.1 acyl-CoA synthetase [Microbacterium oleivorans]